MPCKGSRSERVIGGGNEVRRDEGDQKGGGGGGTAYPRSCVCQR